MVRRTARQVRLNATVQVAVPMSAKERALIREAAAGEPMGRWARARLIEAALHEQDDEEDDDD